MRRLGARHAIRLDQLDEHAAGGLWVDEGHLVARAPLRGMRSIMGTPRASSRAIACSIPSTSTAMWCSPGPRFSRKRSSPSLPFGEMSSTLVSPIGKSAASVFWDATTSRPDASRPSTARHFAAASSMSGTQTAMWSILRILRELTEVSLASARHATMPGVGEAAFYTDAARQAVTEAVVDVESHTAAEVVVVVHRTSGTWREVDLAVGALAGFAVLLLVLFHPKPIPVVAMPVDVALGFVAGAVLCASLSPLKRALLPRRRVAAQVLAMARAAFVEHGVSRTTGRTGILVYVSTFERIVEVVADVGVEPKAVQSEIDALQSSLARGADLGGFVAKVRALGPPSEPPFRDRATTSTSCPTRR